MAYNIAWICGTTLCVIAAVYIAYEMVINAVSFFTCISDDDDDADENADE